MKKRIIPAIIALVLVTICALIAVFGNIDIPNVNIIGSYLSVIAITILMYKFPYSLYIWVLIFDILATAFGSVLNLYRVLGFYDKFVHFISGVILAEIGFLIMMKIFKNLKLPDLKMLALIFGILFSFAGAGAWEIYEFTADQLFGTDMQGNNLNTMGDIVSGFLGGIVYFAFKLVRLKQVNTTF